MKSFIDVGRLFSLACAICVAMLEESPAQEAGPQVVKLVLHAAAIPSPALKYRLTPDAWERKPGNAAQFYYRALLMLRTGDTRERNDLATKWSDKWYREPLTEESRAALKQWVGTFSSSAYGQLRTAVYREQCDFDFNIDSLRGTDAIAFLLPEMQDMREIARHLQGKARLEIDASDFPAALESMRMGYQLSRDVSKEALIINGLVGIASASLMNVEAERWIGAKDAPNLYWAITALPKPLIDLRPAMEYETRLPLQMFSVIADAEDAEHSPEEWMRLLRRVILDMRQISGGRGGDEKPANAMEDVASSLMVMQAYPLAKKDLKKRGYSDEQLAAMPVGKIVAVYLKKTNEYVWHEYAKGLYLDDLQREAYYDGLDQRLIDEGYIRGGIMEPIPIASMLLPALGSATKAQVRLERDLAALRTLEAIRAHLAETGSLPDKLDDIKVVPVPKSPATRELFQYQRDGNTATLEVPPVQKSQGAAAGKRYELSVAR